MYLLPIACARDSRSIAWEFVPPSNRSPAREHESDVLCCALETSGPFAHCNLNSLNIVSKGFTGVRTSLLCAFA